MTVVIDTNVFLAAAFWRGLGRKCWAICAGRHFPIAVTNKILDEYRRKAEELAKRFPQVNPNPFLRWIENECPRFVPSPQSANGAAVTPATTYSLPPPW